MSDGTTLGPVEIAVIGFAGNKFTGEVAPALADLIESGTVSILDLVFVTKDADGSVTAIELSDLDDDIAAPVQGSRRLGRRPAQRRGLRAGR